MPLPRGVLKLAPLVSLTYNIHKLLQLYCNNFHTSLQGKITLRGTEFKLQCVGSGTDLRPGISHHIHTVGEDPGSQVHKAIGILYAILY